MLHASPAYAIVRQGTGTTAPHGCIPCMYRMLSPSSSYVLTSYRRKIAAYCRCSHSTVDAALLCPIHMSPPAQHAPSADLIPHPTTQHPLTELHQDLCDFESWAAPVRELASSRLASPPEESPYHRDCGVHTRSRQTPPGVVITLFRYSSSPLSSNRCGRVFSPRGSLPMSCRTLTDGGTHSPCSLVLPPPSFAATIGQRVVARGRTTRDDGCLCAPAAGNGRTRLFRWSSAARRTTAVA